MVLKVGTAADRSPRYPRLAIMEAIEVARKLYDGVHRSTVETDTAYRVMGFAGKNGASASALGALRQFGLVRGLRGELRISDLALKLFEPSSQDEYEDALVQAASTPSVFAAISTHFQSAIPRADEPIRAYLIRTMDFSKSGADDCIKVLRTTLEQVAGRTSPDNNGSDEGASDSASEMLPTKPPVAVAKSTDQQSPSDMNGARNEFIRIPLSKDCIAELRFVGDITSEGISRLQSYIELMKPIWAE